jgi:hypothetical protein
MQMTFAIAAALIGGGVMIGGPVAAQGRPQDSYALADAPIPAPRAAVTLARVDIPAGTPIPVQLDQEVPLDKNRIGDTFEAHVTRDVKVNGEVVIPSGANAKVRLTESREKSDAATLRLTEVEIHRDLHQVTATDAKADTEADQSGLNGMSTGKKTAVGAAAGAVVGAVTGAGVLEGAVVGAGGGLAWGLLTDNHDRKIDDGTDVRFELERQLNVE